MAGRVVEQEEALSAALGKSFKDADRLVDLSEKIVRIEISIAVFARLEDNPGFPGGDKVV
jgi:hypothetical protein